MRSTATSPDPQALLLTARQVATMLAVSTRHVLAMTARGELPGKVRLGRSRSARWHRPSIERYLERQQQENDEC